jgi:phage shock protein A
MKLIKRMSNLLSANLNDLLDNCEDPEQMLRQAVREMETALGRLMDGAARAIAHHKLLARQQSEQEQAVAQRVRCAELAMARGDEAAARRELRRKIEHTQMADALARQLTTAEELSGRLRHQVSAMRLKLAEARRKLAEITARNRAAVARRKFIEALPTESTQGDFLSTFDRICAKVDQSEAESEALLELLGGFDGEDPFDADVETELRAMREAASHVTH